MKRRYGAMVLAAGLGTRMRPLTARTPKPLLPLLGRPFIARAFDLLVNARIHDVVVNTHHLAARMHDALGDGGGYGVHITWSHEAPVVLGTGGGLRLARRHFNERPIVVINGDTLIDVDLNQVIAAHEATHALATMVLRDAAPGDRYTPVAVQWDERGQAGRVLEIGDAAARRINTATAVFTGVHVIDPRLLDFLSGDDVAPCIVRQGYVPALRDGRRVTAVRQTGLWSDLGTPARYVAAAAALAERPNELHRARFTPAGNAIAVGPRAKVLQSALTAPVVIESEAFVGTGARLGPNVLVGPFARVGAGAMLRDCLVETGAEIAAGAVHERVTVPVSGDPVPWA